MKTPIDPADIRTGDLCRFEASGSDDAYEWRQREFGRGETRSGTYYLLDRPEKPVLAVDLPHPTLGWIVRARGARCLGTWNTYEHLGVDYTIQPEREFPAVDVVDFVKAVAVPASALEFLQAHADCSGPLSCLRSHVDDFLDAVVKANQ